MRSFANYGCSSAINMSEENFVFNVSPETFQAEVIERSKQLPVVLMFWADQVPPSVETRDVLMRLVSQAQGKVLLGLVDVGRDQTLAQHLRVQGLPSIRVVQDGQLTEQVDGPQPEGALQGLLDQLTLSTAEVLKDQLTVLIEREDFATALSLLQQAIEEEPNNQSFQVELADILVMQGNLDDARTTLAGISEEAEERERPENRLEFAAESVDLESQDKLQDKLSEDADNLEIHYQLAVLKVAAREYQSALEHAMTILQRDREFRDDLGRTTMIRIFGVLGKGSELATSYRRKMFNFMH
jgi:putative thioredoxin